MAILSTDVKAWYDMSDGSGTSLTDNSGNGNTGTLTTPDWLTTPKLASFANVLDFVPGNSDYLTLGHQVNNQASFTAAGWFYPDTTTGAQRYMHNGDADNAAHFSMINSAGTLIMRMQSSAGVAQDITNTISAGGWTHLAISYNHAAGTFTAYKNGSSLGTSSSFTVNTNWSGTVVFVGRRENQANQYFDGKCQQVVTINGKACDATEISSLYNAGAGVTYAGFFSAAATPRLLGLLGAGR